MTGRNSVAGGSEKLTTEAWLMNFLSTQISVVVTETPGGQE